jgi:GH24 family phage-related lysozyme (muramidase)
MVTMVDDLADRFGLPRVGSDDWLPFALAMIKRFEGCELNAYPDPGSGGDPWTVGWGATGAGIKKGVTWTQAQADARLAEDVARFARGVDDMLEDAPTTARQKAAMVSLAYNIGLGNFGSSTLLKMHRTGDHASARKQFARWNKAAGRVLAGLTIRRAAEAGLYEGLDA